MGIFDGFNRRKVINRTDGPLGDWARQYNWSYVMRDDNWAHQFTGLPGFTMNDGKEAWHVLRGGHRDRRVDAFHYFYLKKHRDKDNRLRIESHRYMVVNVILPKECPTLTVSREMWDSKFDLDLESIEFNKKFKVKVDRDDAKFAYDILHPRMMEHLLADQRATEWSWPFRFERGDFYTWEEWPRDLDMAVVMQKADYLIDVLDRVPDFVWKD
jgi:hypothetical protein